MRCGCLFYGEKKQNKKPKQKKFSFLFAFLWSMEREGRCFDRIDGLIDTVHHRLRQRAVSWLATRSDSSSSSDGRDSVTTFFLLFSFGFVSFLDFSFLFFFKFSRVFVNHHKLVQTPQNKPSKTSKKNLRKPS